MVLLLNVGGRSTTRRNNAVRDPVFRKVSAAQADVKVVEARWRP